MEIRFLANIIDQLDFALDHMALADVNYKRLALMLTTMPWSWRSTDTP
jgi:hypothetical protein